jgi:hypothetical protein
VTSTKRAGNHNRQGQPASGSRGLNTRDDPPPMPRRRVVIVITRLHPGTSTVERPGNTLRRYGHGGCLALEHRVRDDPGPTHVEPRASGPRDPGSTPGSSTRPRSDAHAEQARADQARVMDAPPTWPTRATRWGWATGRDTTRVSRNGSHPRPISRIQGAHRRLAARDPAGSSRRGLRVWLGGAVVRRRRAVRPRDAARGPQRGARTWSPSTQMVVATGVLAGRASPRSSRAARTRAAAPRLPPMESL